VNALDGGHLVGRYRILRFLGAGAMGEVYLAEDPQIDRQLAIKTVRLVGRPQEIEDRKRRLLREARAAGRLLHPNVVTLFDAGEAEGLLYLAFEFVEGTDLAARLDPGQQRLSLRQVLRIVRQAAEALDYAHGQGIVHRDIKPGNILLDRAGRVKVADFGIAKMAGQSTELTMAGSVMGSPQYLSPEQIRGDDLDGRSDIFSLGVVFYEMLSGKRPFEGDTITTLVYQILHKDPPPVSELRAVPPRVEELLRGMLAKSLDERIPTAGEVARELAAIEAELSDETLSAPAGSGPLDATRVLPRRTTDAAILPAGTSGARPALGTVPASPETTPSVPPPAPTVAAPIPTASMPAPPVPAVPMAAAPMPPPPAQGRKFPIALLVAGLLLLIAVGAIAGGGYYVWKLWRMRDAASEPSTQTAETSQTAPPAVSPASSVSPAPVRPAPEVKTPPQTSAATSQSPPPAARPTPVEKVPAPAPSSAPPAVVPPPARPREQRVPGPAAGEPAAPAPAPAPREPEPEAAPEAPAADQTIRTGLQVGFRITPPDAHVLVEGRVIGEAQDWSGQKGARTYTFPGAGTYMVKIKKDGMKDMLIAVEAGAGGASTISARLRPRAAADIDASDLESVRVREGVALNVRPGNAEVLVDGQPVGEARRYAGGLLRPREILVLNPGKHRLSFVAPGGARKDVLVEVTETADKQRQRINVDLTAGGNGG
jgi:serine/threonine protein kinase/outer membrane biosynthesis protein TonB